MPLKQKLSPFYYLIKLSDIKVVLSHIVIGRNHAEQRHNHALFIYFNQQCNKQLVNKP